MAEKPVSGVRVALRRLWSLLCYICREIWAGFRSAPLWKQLIIPIVIVVGILLLFLTDVPPLIVVRHGVARLGRWFPFVFFLCYVLLTLFPIPRTFFTLISGILFPPLLALAVCLGATVLSAVVACALTRYVFRGWVEEHLHHPMLDALNERLEKRGWLAVGSLRLIPFVPFSVLNYAAALTPVRMLPFAVATLVCSAPGTTAGVLFGEAAVGHANPWVILVGLCCCAMGIVGLVIDAKMPVTTSLREPPARSQNQ